MRVSTVRSLLVSGMLWLSPAFTLVYARSIPHPLPGHPGNVFLAGEPVTVTLPPRLAAGWQLVDYDGHPLTNGISPTGVAKVGPLPVGWYEFRPPGATPETLSSNRLSVGVLVPLRAPTPLTSPISLDVAMAWFYATNQMPAVANLCALAGVNRVRDRLTWAEMEPRRGQFVEGSTRYDASAAAQHAAGLLPLQVAHRSPAWANPDQARFPLNLRDAYNFWRAMARRWRGEVVAFEPWNEADIKMFGGHMGSEIASYQKASYFGLKAGNPNVIACLSVFAMDRSTTLADFRANHVGPYFDTYNFHHYVPLADYPRVYAHHRALSVGKPLWVTECNVPVHWSGDPRLKEPSAANLKVQAKRVAKIFATSIYEGAAATFYFLLPQYSEGQTQFGILRSNLTPRPAFVALAAAGRLLAGARPLGQLPRGPANLRGYLFAARPDGHRREVLVAWTTRGVARLALPVRPQAEYDLLGRPHVVTGLNAELNSAPRFVVLPRGTVAGMHLISPPAAPSRQREKACPVVLQAQLPATRVMVGRSAYRLLPTKTETLHFRAYNFSRQDLRGRLRLDGPKGWQLKGPTTIELTAEHDADFVVQVNRHKAPAVTGMVRLAINGDFGRAGLAHLSIRFAAAETK